MGTKLSKRPLLMVAALCAAYGSLYLGRVNVSVVLPILADDLGIGLAEVGALGTVFFWFYGIFQLVSGEVSSRFSPFRIISLGLLATAVINLVFSFQTSLIAMLLLWGLNGIAQSAGWSPMVRILAERLDADHIRRASTLMPFGYVIGTAVTWTLIGAVTAGGNWRIAFWLPGLLLLVILALWWKADIDAPMRETRGASLRVMLGEARAIVFVLFVAALAGFVRNGSLIWLPTYILDTGLFAEGLVGTVAAVMQIVAIPGSADCSYSRGQQRSSVHDRGCAVCRRRLWFSAGHGDCRRRGDSVCWFRLDDVEWRFQSGDRLDSFADGAAGPRFVHGGHGEHDGDILWRDGWFRHRRIA